MTIIGNIDKEMSSTETSLALTKAMAEKVLANAQAVYKEALNLMGDAIALVVPKIGWANMKRQAEQHSEEALRLRESADKLMSEHAQVVSYCSLPPGLLLLLITRNLLLSVMNYLIHIL